MGGKGVLLGNKITLLYFYISPNPHCIILPFQLFYYFIISPYKLSRHIIQHLYQCNILPDYLGGCSEASYVDKTEPDYMSESRKYDTSLHITPEYLDKIPILNKGLRIIMKGLKRSSNLVSAKPPSARIIVLQEEFFNALNYGYLVTLRKILDQIESCMQYKFTYHKTFTRQVFQK